MQDENTKEDYLYNYHKAKLRFGLLLVDINDAIREGDGERLLHLFKIAMLIYKCHGHTKYAYTTLLFLTKVFAILSEEEAQSLIWNRFCNSNGGKGKNISLDLRLEQFNNLLKACIKVLGANFTKASAQRIARSINNMEIILQSVDKDCQLEERLGTRANKDVEEAVSQIVEDLIRNDVFVHTPGREGHPSYPSISSNILNKMDYRSLYTWMKSLLKVWESIYE